MAKRLHITEIKLAGQVPRMTDAERAAHRAKLRAEVIDVYATILARRLLQSIREKRSGP